MENFDSRYIQLYQWKIQSTISGHIPKKTNRQCICNPPVIPYWREFWCSCFNIIINGYNLSLVLKYRRHVWPKGIRVKVSHLHDIAMVAYLR